MIRVAILTISDSCAEQKCEDRSGPAAREMLAEEAFEVCQERIVPDDRDAIVEALVGLCDDGGYDVLLTTGGTGMGPRDVTPEATAFVCERIVPGLGELIRAGGLKKTPNVALSRGVAGVRGKTLIINLPGSPKAVRESLALIVGVLPHAVEMMRGGGH